MTSLPAWVAIGCLALYGSARPGLRRDLHGLALLPVLAWVAVFGLALPGCKDTDRRYVAAPASPAPPAPSPPASWRDEFSDLITVPHGRWHTLPAGNRVWIPSYLDTRGHTAAVLAEVASTPPLRDPRYVPDPIPPGVVGPPPGWEVVLCTERTLILSDQVVHGVTYSRPDRRIYVAVASANAPDAQGRWAPALGHELGHAYYGETLPDLPDLDARVGRYGLGHAGP